MTQGAARKATTVSAHSGLVAEAEFLGIDVSEVFERALEASVREARRCRWMEENREGFAAYDRFVETNGVFSQGKKLF